MRLKACHCCGLVQRVPVLDYLAVRFAIAGAAVLLLFHARESNIADRKALNTFGRVNGVLERDGRPVDIDAVSRNRSALLAGGSIDLRQQVLAVERESGAREGKNGCARQHQPRRAVKGHEKVP